MERTMSVEEKIRRAEQIYERRKQGSDKQIATVSVNNEKKRHKIIKKNDCTNINMYFNIFNNIFYKQ